ncbi:MAG: SDR family oxidoreductase [Alphaproteobacteria bacterium]|nr:SDR family oxidoreductase [Alphaproteobacteria bacterium]
MDFKLAGKVAIVAGGSRGCGLACAEELAREGASVVLTGRQPAIVEAAVARVEAAGGKVKGLATEMVSEADVRHIVDQCRATFGDPDVLVVNPPSPTLISGLEAIAESEYVLAYEYYVLSLVRFLKEVIPAMQARRWGRIVTLGTVGMKSPHLQDPQYSQNIRVAAAAVMKTMAHEYGRYNITGNTIATGSFDSDLANDYIAAHGLTPDAFSKSHPMGRVGQPEEMGAVVAFLCSDRASFLSGETIRVDGGATRNLF